MAGPYAGMNPYLEDPFHWQGFHNVFISEIMKALNAHLPAGYRAVVEQRLTILPEDQVRRADLAVLSRPAGGPGVAVKERGLPDGKVGALFEEVYDWFVEIRAGQRHESRVVTVVEMLSPTNKAAGSQGRREYQQKQRELVHSETHLMEIDLLRHGAHTVVAPLDLLPPRGAWDYIVSLHRVTERFQCEYWLNRLPEPLPEVRVPLSAGDPDVLLDLQAAYREAYAAGRYEQDIDFSAPLPRDVWRPREEPGG